MKLFDKLSTTLNVVSFIGIVLAIFNIDVLLGSSMFIVAGLAFIFQICLKELQHWKLNDSTTNNTFNKSITS